MGKTLKTASLFAFCFLCLGTAAGAAEKTEEQETGKEVKSGAIEAPAVTVTATRTEHALEEVPMSLGVVTEKDIQRDTHFDVAGQLENIPGILVQSGNNASGRRVSIRGMSSGRTLILIDGVRQNQQRGMNEGGFFNIDPAVIERIEVIKGPSSVLYGSDSIGGVVNIITKSGANAAKPFGFRLGVNYDSSVSGLEPNGSVYGNYKGINYIFSSSGMDAHDRHTPEGDLWHSGFSQRENSGKLGYEWESGSITFGVDRFLGTSEFTPTRTDPVTGKTVPTDPWETPGNTTVLEYDQDRTTYTGNLSLKDISSVFSKFSLDAYIQDHDYNSIYYPTFRNPAYYANDQKTRDTINTHKSYGGTLQTDWTFGDSHYVVAGLSYDHVRLESALSAFTAAGLKTVSDIRDGYQRTTALFLQDEWEVIEDLTLTLGLRQTWVETALEKYTNAPSFVDSSSDNHLNGSVGIVYSGIENFDFRALWSQGYREPKLIEMFMGSIAHGGIMLANPNLKPETSNNYEVGVRYNDGALSADLAVFYNDVKDGISNIIVNPGSPVVERQYINNASQKVLGAEISLSYHFEDYGLTPYVNATFLHMENTDYYGFSTTDTGTPDAWGQVGLRWEGEITEGHTMFADANWTLSNGAYYESKNNNTGVVTKSDYGSSWNTVNFSAGFEGKLPGTALKYNTALNFRNICDQYYVPTGSIMPEPGFNVVWTFGIEY